MTPEIIIGFAAACLSLLFLYVPGLKPWYDKKTSQTKQLIMLGLLFLSVAITFGLSCAGQNAYFVCDISGAWLAGKLFITAMIVNQGVYKSLNYVGTGKVSKG